jgi:ribose transport system ATP-binding protein
MNNKRVILSVSDCTKTFPGVTAFNKVDFDLYEGEIHCLVGENGAGKTTFIKILSGALTPDSGSVTINGTRVEHFSPDTAHRLGVRAIYQEQNLAPALTVAENIFLGRQFTTRLGLVDYRTLRRRAKEVLDTLKVSIDPDILVERLNIADRQSVQIAAALAQDARVLIMDEPTASYGQSEIKGLLERVLSIAAGGVGIVYISHHMEEVFEIADRITVMRDGRKIKCHSRAEVTPDILLKEMVGRDITLFYTREQISRSNGTLEIRHMTRSPAVQDVSFSAGSGEVVGIAGMVGSGRTELARLIIGADRRDAGTVVLEGRDITPRDPVDATRRGLCLITEDRQRSGLALGHSIKWNITLAGHNRRPGWFIGARKETGDASDFVSRLRIVTPSIEQEVRFLSGGNQQKVVLSKWLYADARVLIFDEPTRGIDIGAKEEIYKLMTSLAKEGRYIIMISSDMPELIAMSDRVLVMRAGRLSGELSGKDITEENILSSSIGGRL